MINLNKNTEAILKSQRDQRITKARHRIRIPYAILHQENIKIDSLKSFLPKVSCCFCTLFILN